MAIDLQPGAQSAVRRSARYGSPVSATDGKRDTELMPTLHWEDVDFERKTHPDRPHPHHDRGSAQGFAWLLLGHSQDRQGPAHHRARRRRKTISYQFKKALRAAGLPTIRLHDLRHTHAPLELHAGVHPRASLRSGWVTPTCPPPWTPTATSTLISRPRQPRPCRRATDRGGPHETGAPRNPVTTS